MDTIIEQEQRICEFILNSPGIQLVKTTPLFVIIRARKVLNRGFALTMNDAGWAVTTKKGLNSDLYYCCIHLNQPPKQ